MALLAEELVEEWLNRQGYFTIRGIKVGVDEIDLLAIKHGGDGSIDYRHIEVQASMRPIGYISRIPKSLREHGQSGSSAKKRTEEELRAGVKEWVHKKFNKPNKVAVIQSLCDADWNSELVANNVRSDRELEMISEEGVMVIRLPIILNQLRSSGFLIQSASGADFADLLNLSNQID